MRKLPDCFIKSKQLLKHPKAITLFTNESSNIAPLSWQNGNRSDARIQGQNFVLDATRFPFNSSHSHYDCPPSHPTVVDWYPLLMHIAMLLPGGPTPPL